MNNNSVEEYNLYNLYNLDKSNIDKSNKSYCKGVESIINSLDKGLKVNKYLGSVDESDIFLLNSNTNSKKAKLICKKMNIEHLQNLNISSKNGKQSKNIKNIIELLNYIYYNKLTKDYIIPILDYKTHDGFIYLIFPYYKGYNLQQFKKNLVNLETEHYKTIVKHIIKKVLQGISNMHQLGIYYGNINEQNILVNTNNKKLKVKVKFFNINNQPHNFYKTNLSHKKKKASKKTKKSKTSSNINTHIKTDIKELAPLLLDLISYKYLDEHNNTSRKKKSILDKALEYLNFKQNEPSKMKTFQDLINEDEIDEDLLFYVNIIKNQMITKQDNLNDVLKEILLHEKYNS